MLNPASPHLLTPHYYPFKIRYFQVIHSNSIIKSFKDKKINLLSFGNQISLLTNYNFKFLRKRIHQNRIYRSQKSLTNSFFIFFLLESYSSQKVNKFLSVISLCHKINNNPFQVTDILWFAIYNISFVRQLHCLLSNTTRHLLK